jgi:hypothetical protein
MAVYVGNRSNIMPKHPFMRNLPDLLILSGKELVYCSIPYVNSKLSAIRDVLAMGFCVSSYTNEN